tara:strand:- start:2240 stop:3073 length:834 start_codon:yes stop_codon:yes gene_type:complete
MNTEQQKLVTVGQARKVLACSAQSVRRFIKEGLLEASKTETGRWLVSEDSISQLVNQKKTQQTSKKATSNATNVATPTTNLQGKLTVNHSNRPRSIGVSTLQKSISDFRELFNENYHDILESDCSDFYGVIVNNINKIDKVDDFTLGVYCPSDSISQIAEYVIWQLPQYYSDFINQLPIFNSYYEYRSRFPTHFNHVCLPLYLAVFFQGQFVIKSATMDFNTTHINEGQQVNQIFAEKQAEIDRQNSPLAFLGALGTAIIEAQPQIQQAFQEVKQKK